MRNILLIGLGRFGMQIAVKLSDMHVQVMAVDRSEEQVQKATPYVTNALIGDSTDEEFLKTLGVANFDICIVAIGDDFLSSLEITASLKELGAKKVISRASNDMQSKFLLRNGADGVVNPENRWRTGWRCGADRKIFSTILNWRTATPFSISVFRRNGAAVRSGRSISGKSIRSVSSRSRKKGAWK
jgi:Trk K+ transport system NAD-binding subunit